jgi:hypothetical protein
MDIPVRSRSRWIGLILVIVALGFTAAFAGHTYGYTGGPYQLLKPRFDDPSQHIRYHDGFHDGHSHDGYGHGFHDSNSQHDHNRQGNAETPSNRNQVIRYQGLLPEQTCHDVYGADNPLCAPEPPEPPHAHEVSQYPVYRPGLIPGFTPASAIEGKIAIQITLGNSGISGGGGVQ